MNTPASLSETPEPKKTGLGRRIAACVVLSVLIFGVLWYAVFTAVTAALVAAGVTGLLVVGSSTSEIGETILDMLAEMVLGIIASIAAFLAAIFSIFS